MKKIILFLMLALLALTAFSQDYPEEVYPEPSFIDDKKEVQRRMSPGIGYGAFMPRDWENIGIFHGINTEISFYTAKRSGYDGPGYFKFYTRFNMMKSTENSNGGLFTYSVGTNMSFEKNVERNFLVPYYGIEIGGLNRTDIRKAAFQVTPLLGVSILAFNNVNWFIQGGYTYAASRDFNTLSGGFANSGISVSFW